MAESVESLSSIAASAASVIDAAAPVLAALASIIAFIAGIISFFTGKSEEQKKAEKRHKEAKRKAEKARKLVEDRLAIDDLTITLSKMNEVEVSWKRVEKSVKYYVRLTRTDLGDVETVLLETTTEDNKVSFEGGQINYNTKNVTAYVHASLVCKGVTFKGKEQLFSKTTKHLLRAPSKVEVECKQKGREVHVTFSQVTYAVDYKVEVLTHDEKVIGTAIVKRSSEDQDKEKGEDNNKDKDETHVFYADKLTAGVPGKTRVRVCARGNEEKLNEFKYSTDLYLVESPTDTRRFYDPQSQELLVKWRVQDTRNISSYQCDIRSIDPETVVFTKEVAKSKDDGLESIQIRLSEISDRTKSSYIVSVCSLGVSASLASTFVTIGNLAFLPQVAGATSTYDPQRNQLTVSWMPVARALDYKVSMREKTDISSVVENLTSAGGKNVVVFELVNVQLKSEVKYVVTVAAEGSDSLHLPGLPFTADKEFTQLQKPGSVTQKYSFLEKKIKVTFQPVPLASAHLVEVFNESTPWDRAGRYVFPKAADSDDWPPTVTYSFDVEKMRFNGAMFKSRVTAQGNANRINSPPCVSPTVLECSDTPISVDLKYISELSKLLVIISSRPGNFTAKVEDTSGDSGTISTQQFIVPQDSENEAARQTSLEILLSPDKKKQGAIYQAFVQNPGNQQYLPSEVKQSNKVAVLDPPESVEQDYKDHTLIITWKSVQLAVGYKVRVYNTKTGNTASEASLMTNDACPTEEQMKKEFDAGSLSLESDGLYETLVTVLGGEVSIGGASTKSHSTIPSCPCPKEVKISYNNDARRMVVCCSSVNGAVSFKLGVADARKLTKQETNIQGALMGCKEVAVSSSDDGVPIEAEFDDSILIPSMDGRHSGVAQVIKEQAKSSLPSGFSISEGVVSWLKPAVPINLFFDPVNSTLKITWTHVNLATHYLVEILQTRQGKPGPTTLTPFSDEVRGNVLSLDVSTEELSIEETDKFKAKVQPSGTPGTVITLNATGYSSEILVCENSPTSVHVSQVEDEAVVVNWKGDTVAKFQLRIWKMLKSGDQEKVIDMVSSWFGIFIGTSPFA